MARVVVVAAAAGVTGALGVAEGAGLEIDVGRDWEAGPALLGSKASSCEWIPRADRSAPRSSDLRSDGMGGSWAAGSALATGSAVAVARGRGRVGSHPSLDVIVLPHQAFFENLSNARWQ